MALRGGKLKPRRKRVPVRADQYRLGHKAGYEEGVAAGYAGGWKQGVESFGVPFEGTSIVIPTYNQLDLLKDCIESIRTHTPEPHEIIVIDNGSTDGTADYLRSMAGQVRSKVFPRNLGFAGGTNQGLMMARGTTLMMLNNDTVVTRGWLARLLECLHSQPRAALVGPVTNYISGEQLIETEYRTMPEMHAFAQRYHQTHGGSWKTTGRLTGFCVLFTRETFRRIGYMDEGFVIGNCEDDDFGHRARLLGMELVIAANTFIHHAGSKTIKSLDRAKFDEIYGRNLAFYSEKWGEASALLAEVERFWDRPLAMTDYYPQHVVVQGPGIGQYWLEGGVRYPLDSGEPLDSVRLSQTDLSQWPVGADLSQAEWETKLEVLLRGRTPEGNIPDGSLIRTDNGHLWQLRQGKLHRIITELTQKAWKLEGRPVLEVGVTEIGKYEIGQPIMAPPRIHANNI